MRLNAGDRVHYHYDRVRIPLYEQHTNTCTTRKARFQQHIKNKSSRTASHATCRPHDNEWQPRRCFRQHRPDNEAVRPSGGGYAQPDWGKTSPQPPPRAVYRQQPPRAVYRLRLISTRTFNALPHVQWTHVSAPPIPSGRMPISVQYHPQGTNGCPHRLNTPQSGSTQQVDGGSGTAAMNYREHRRRCHSKHLVRRPATPPAGTPPPLASTLPSSAASTQRLRRPSPTVSMWSSVNTMIVLPRFLEH